MKADLPDEDLAVRGRGSGIPFEHVVPACVIVGQGVGQGIVRRGIALEQFAEVIGAGQRVGAGIVTLLVRKGVNALRIGPLLRRAFLELHQTDFTSSPMRIRSKPALAPNQRPDEQRIDAITPGGRADLRDKPAFPPLFPP